MRRALQRAPAGEVGDEPLLSALARERQLYGVQVPGRVFDIGTEAGYRQASLAAVGGHSL